MRKWKRATRIGATSSAPESPLHFITNSALPSRGTYSSPPRGHSPSVPRGQTLSPPRGASSNQYHESLPRGVGLGSHLYTSPPRRTTSGVVNGVSSSPPVRDRAAVQGSVSAPGSLLSRGPTSSASHR